MSIVIRHAEPSDFEAVQGIFEAPEAIAGTLQVPFPSAEVWRKLLSEQQPGGKILLAVIDGRVVGQIGIHTVPRPRKGPRRLYRNGSSRRVASSGRRIG